MGNSARETRSDLRPPTASQSRTKKDFMTQNKMNKIEPKPSGIWI